MSIPESYLSAARGAAADTRLIFFDVDGTLLDSQGQYSGRLAAVLNELKRRGLALAIASGRPPFACQFLFEALPLVDMGLFYTGGLIFEPSTERCLQSKPLPNRDAQALFHEAQRAGLYFELYDQDRLIVDPDYIADRDILTEHARQLRCQPSYSAIKPLLQGQNAQMPWNKVLLGENSQCSSRLEGLEAQYPHLHFAYAKLPSYPHWRFASVIPNEADKQQAFDRLLDYYQISAEQVMSFGDAGSDKVFLARAGLGVAMGNADPTVQSCANYCCPSSDEDGVAKALAHLFDIPV